MSVRFPACVVALFLAASATAFAQGTYVSASVFGDVLRSTYTEYPGAPDLSGGEAIGFALRLGTPLGSVWGVEIEYARPGEIENEGQPTILPLAERTVLFPSLGNAPISQIFPSFFIRTTQRNTTLSAALWIQQQLSGRVAMVYLGGMAFARSTHEYEYSFPRLPMGLPIPPALIALPPFENETVIYGVRPLAGIESRIAMTDRAQLVAGIRLQASDGMWLIRPSVGVGWMF